jgi:hypothetical protein
MDPIVTQIGLEAGHEVDLAILADDLVVHGVDREIALMPSNILSQPVMCEPTKEGVWAKGTGNSSGT